MATRAVAKKTKGSNPNLPVLAEAEWEREVAEHATDATALGGGGVESISTKGGKFTFNGAVLSQPLAVIILDVVRENAYYEGEYDADEVKPPRCFAIARVEKPGDDEQMAPPADLKTKESERCASCWANEFGSAERGKGKACKNRLRLAVLPAGDVEPEVLVRQDPALLRVPPTSIKHFSKYAKQLSGAMKKPPFAVVTELELHDDDSAMFRFSFDFKGALGAQQGAVVVAKRAAIADDMMRTFSTEAAEEKPAAKREKKPRGKYDVDAKTGKLRR